MRNRFTPTREHIVKSWIPAEHVVFEEPGFAIYLFDQRDGRPAAAGFIGKRAKPDLWSVYPDTQRRDAAVAKFVQRRREDAAFKEEMKVNRKVTHNPFNVGDIVYNSWGYEQTNIDWYQVTKVNKKSVYIRPIAQARDESHGWMSGTCVPVPDKFTGPPVLKHVRMWKGNGSLSFEFGGCGRWDGTPVNWSGYH